MSKCGIHWREPIVVGTLWNVQSMNVSSKGCMHPQQKWKVDKNTAHGSNYYDRQQDQVF
jgi:hypothetical protein